MPEQAVPPDRQILSPSALARSARLLIEANFNQVWVEGEISNFRRPASGHWYFTLKDDRAQLRCAMFVNRNRFMRIAPRDGLQVLVRGRVSLYEERGDFQLIAEHMEPAGEGALRAAFEALQRKLSEEGLFAADRKRPLPAFPNRIAVITSATGAALRDMLAVWRRRYPALEVIVLPVAVQGAEAEGDIVRAFSRVHLVEPDLVILARGGGSLEDLWAFNLENVARAVDACVVPVVSAIGHETDVTITDLIADVRAPTPTAAAELTSADQQQLMHTLQGFRRRMLRSTEQDLAAWRAHIRHLRSALVSPAARVQQWMQRTDELGMRAQRAITHTLRNRASTLQRQEHALALLHPARALSEHAQRLLAAHRRLAHAERQLQQARNQRLTGVVRTLRAVSPLATMDRGFAILRDTSGRPVQSIEGRRTGDQLQAVLRDGLLSLEVKGTDPDNGLTLSTD